jgi:hypothetical protein
LRGYPHTSDFGVAYHKAMGAPWSPSKHKIAMVDLTLTEQERRKYLRPSYKSLLNWGRKNIEWRASTDIDPLQWFHAKIAGRSTRSQLTWDLLEAEVQQGRGDILYGHIGPELVSGSLYIDGGWVCIYWSGVYERSLFPKPLAHYGLWLGMNRAAERGNRWFELGELPEGEGKEANIGRFKAGFATHIIGGDSPQDGHG